MEWCNTIYDNQSLKEWWEGSILHELLSDLNNQKDLEIAAETRKTTEQ